MASDDIPPTSNPAGRLWHIARTAKNYQAEPMVSGMASIFGVASATRADALRCTAQVMDLIDEVERWMRQVPGIKANKYLAWAESARAPFSQIGTMGTTIGHLFARFDEQALSLISICSDHLEMHFREPQADDEGVRRLLDLTLDLIAKIARADLDPAAREYILKHLKIVADALYDYRTQGFDALWQGLASCMGHEKAAESRSGINFETIRKTPEWAKVVAIVGGLAALVQTAQNVEWVLQKGADVARWVLPGSVATDASEQEPREAGGSTQERNL